jgi:Spy/CpxP family protein refolding chaperone
MRSVTKYFLAAACAVAFIASADAQGQGRRAGGGAGGAGGQPPGGGRGQGGGMMGGFGGGPTTLLVNKSVLEELKVTDEQKTKLADWAKDATAKQREKMQEVFTPGERPDMAKMQEMMASINKEQMEDVSKVLKEDQVKRFKEISLQIQGFRAFQSKEVQTSLKLSDEQKDALKEIGELRFLFVSHFEFFENALVD